MPDACSAFAWPIDAAKTAMSGSLPDVASGDLAPQDFALALAPTEGVAFPTKPERAPKGPGTFGGFVTTSPPAGSTLQVTLSDDAWVDVVQGGAVVKSAAFSGKGGCEGVRKSVRFVLPGRGQVTLQVSGTSVRSLRVDLRGLD